MLIQAPVIRSACIEERKVTAAPIGSGQPNLPMGRFLSINSFTVSSELFLINLSHDPQGKSIDQGAIELTVTQSLAIDIAKCLVEAIIAALAVIYGAVPPNSLP